MSKEIYVIQARYEKNSSDGISYHTDLNDLAEAVYDAERCGGVVQVYKCVPIDHSVYTSRVTIELYDPQTRKPL